MDFTDVSLTALRVLRAVSEQGTFTAAAASLGYTQSAVSRQIASIERAAGTELLERRRGGVRLTPAGRIVMTRATVVLDEIDATARELSGLPGQGEPCASAGSPAPVRPWCPTPSPHCGARIRACT